MKISPRDRSEIYTLSPRGFVHVIPCEKVGNICGKAGIFILSRNMNATTMMRIKISMDSPCLGWAAGMPLPPVLMTMANTRSIQVRQYGKFRHTPSKGTDVQAVCPPDPGLTQMYRFCHRSSDLFLVHRRCRSEGRYRQSRQDRKSPDSRRT